MKTQHDNEKGLGSVWEICYCPAINDSYYWRNIDQDARKQLANQIKPTSHLCAYHQVAIFTKQLCKLSQFFLTLFNGLC